jgi:integrase
MAIANLTEDFVRKLKVPEGDKDITVFDKNLRGFGVRKYAKGHASYFVKYSINGRSRKATLGPVVEGNLKAMRQAAVDYLRDARDRKDRRAELKAAAEAVARLKTLGELVPIYLALREKGDQKWEPLKPRTLVDFTRYLTKAWAPLHATPVEQITRQMVEKRRDEIAKEARTGNGAVTANRAHTALAGLFKWAIQNVSAKPTGDIDPLKEHKRKRYLPEPELVEVWHACGDDDFGRILKLLMLTGCRREEIGGLQWSEIHVKTHIDKETKAETKYHAIELAAERVKNKEEHIVPLSAPALAIVRACERDRHESRRYVFGGSGRFLSWHYGKQRLDERIAARRKVEGRPPMDHWTIHDLRRSFVTHLNELGIAPPHIIEALVNHVSGAAKNGVAGTYNRARYIKERWKALEHWGEVLAGQAGFVLAAPQNEATDELDELSSQVV